MTTQLRLVPPSTDVSIRESPATGPWWEAPELRELVELRRRIIGGDIPCRPPETAEESARFAVFWLLYEGEHILRELVRRVQAGERVLLRSGVYIHTAHRVDFNLRIVEHVEIGSSGGGR